MTIITLKLLWDPSIVIRARKNNSRNIGAKNQLLVDPNVHLIQGGSETLVPIELILQLKRMRSFQVWLRNLFSAILQLTVVKISLI